MQCVELHACSLCSVAASSLLRGCRIGDRRVHSVVAGAAAGPLSFVRPSTGMQCHAARLGRFPLPISLLIIIDHLLPLQELPRRRITAIANTADAARRDGAAGARGDRRCVEDTLFNRVAVAVPAARAADVVVVVSGGGGTAAQLTPVHRLLLLLLLLLQLLQL